jgi:hypothetical protein
MASCLTDAEEKPKSGHSYGDKLPMAAVPSNAAFDGGEAQGGLRSAPKQDNILRVYLEVLMNVGKGIAYG